jgi:hypothetical protein
MHTASDLLQFLSNKVYIYLTGPKIEGFDPLREYYKWASFRNTLHQRTENIQRKYSHGKP